VVQVPRTQLAPRRELERPSEVWIQAPLLDLSTPVAGPKFVARTVSAPGDQASPPGQHKHLLIFGASKREGFTNPGRIHAAHEYS
jgi:hypothetical protein